MDTKCTTFIMFSFPVYDPQYTLQF